MNPETAVYAAAQVFGEVAEDVPADGSVTEIRLDDKPHFGVRCGFRPAARREDGGKSRVANKNFEKTELSRFMVGSSLEN